MYKILIFVFILSACGGAGQRRQAVTTPTVETINIPTVAIATPVVCSAPEFTPTPYPVANISRTLVFTKEVDNLTFRYLKIFLDNPNDFTVRLVGKTNTYLPLPGEKPGVFVFRIPLDENVYQADILRQIKRVEVKAK